jgi:hypothetical protein
MNATAVPTPAKATTDAQRCTVTTESGRRCMFVVHTDATKHRFVDRTRKHEALSAVLPAGFSLNVTEVKADEVIRKQTNRKDTAPRDADQKKVDAAVKVNFTKNNAKSHTTETEWGSLSLAEYIVPPKAVETVLDYLRRATGTGGTAAGAQLRYRKGTHGSGNTRIQWAVVARAPKKPATPTAVKDDSIK